MPEDQYPEDEIEVPAHMITGVNPAEVFALTVKGDSMMDAMIQDGDVIVLRHTNEAHNGDMVAVWMTDRNETTLKYFHHEGERIRLQPAHPSMEPIYVDPQFCQVQGKVLSVMRHIG
jgi:repressor LexA